MELTKAQKAKLTKTIKLIGTIMYLSKDNPDYELGLFGKGSVQGVLVDVNEEIKVQFFLYKDGNVRNTLWIDPKYLKHVQ